MGDIEATGLPFFGGCEICHASIACYNAYPSKSNYLRCRSCMGTWDSPQRLSSRRGASSLTMTCATTMMATLTNSDTGTRRRLLPRDRRRPEHRGHRRAIDEGY